MQTLDHDEVTIHIDSRPDEVYALIADVTRTPQFSPEVLSCVWLDGATGPAVGARFEATNKVRRGRSWKYRPVVTVAETGKEFAFSRTEKVTGTLVWRYRFQPAGTGTHVSESYEVTRPVSRVGWFVMERFFGSRDRRAELRAGMQQTLERLKAAAEAEQAATGQTPSTRAEPG